MEFDYCSQCGLPRKTEMYGARPMCARCIERYEDESYGEFLAQEQMEMEVGSSI